MRSLPTFTLCIIMFSACSDQPDAGYGLDDIAVSVGLDHPVVLYENGGYVMKRHCSMGETNPSRNCEQKETNPKFPAIPPIQAILKADYERAILPDIEKLPIKYTGQSGRRMLEKDIVALEDFVSELDISESERSTASEALEDLRTYLDAMEFAAHEASKIYSEDIVVSTAFDKDFKRLDAPFQGANPNVIFLIDGKWWYYLGPRSWYDANDQQDNQSPTYFKGCKRTYGARVASLTDLRNLFFTSPHARDVEHRFNLKTTGSRYLWTSGTARVYGPYSPKEGIIFGFIKPGPGPAYAYEEKSEKTMLYPVLCIRG